MTMKTQLTESGQNRQTRYVGAVIEALTTLGHATNLELLGEVQKAYPGVSATTIHRVTARLKERGVIASAPKARDGSERYDITAEDHHHFVCNQCGRVCDVANTEESREVIARLKQLSGECAIAGSLTMEGTCKYCTGGLNE